MDKSVTFELNGLATTAKPGETIWQIAQRLGETIPHLCHKDAMAYAPDGNCRTCMVEVEGEQVLAASCIRTPTSGMKVHTRSERAETSRRLVFELLVADQPDTAHDAGSHFWNMAKKVGQTSSRLPRSPRPECDLSHQAMSVNLDACIHCNLCVRACRDVQVNDVIGMSGRGGHAKIVFDMDDPMGDSTCVACGECVQACPTGALMPALLMDETQQKFPEPATKIVDSLCPFCGVGCQTRFHVKDNRIVWVEGRDGPANQGKLCIKGRFGMDYASHDNRLTTPLIRRNDAPAKTWDMQVNPANPWTHFREASWEEAMAEAAEGFTRLRTDHGPDCLTGFGSAKGSNEEAYMFQKLVRTGFGTNNVDHCTRLCHASSIAALMEGINSGAVSAPFNAAEDSDCIIVIGARPTVNHPVAATFLKQAAKAGTTLIIIDPRGQEMDRHADYSLHFKPGSDVSLLNALIYTIIEENLIDLDYIAAHVDNYDAIAANIIDFSPEKMQDICGIAAETLRATARTYAKAERSIIFWGMGISQHVHGTDNARCLITLATITGQIGRPGTGLHPLRGQNNVQGASDAGLIPMVLPDYQSVANPEIRLKFEQAWGSPIDPNPGLTMVEIIDAACAGDIKGMYVMGENPAMSDPNTHHTRTGLANLEHLVVQEIFLTETAMFADVILPASAFPEKSGTFTNTNRQVQLARPALTLPGQARQDWFIIQELAQRLGLDWKYADVSEVYEEMRSVMPSIAGISWKRLNLEDSVTYPCAAEDEPGQSIIFTDGFPTLNGRAQLKPVQIVPPDETPDANYPMVLTTGRLLEHWHTGAMTRRAAVLDGCEPEAMAHLNPRWLDKQGLNPGDEVVVSTRRGAIRLRTRADQDVSENTIFIPFCYAESPANMLTNPALDPFGKIPEFKFCAAKVETLETS
ncbi:MAG: formate dehydrogenase subunit alpha [Alphaproteobacteria bacterium]|nr:formate dehydrogenase subunit alpha [Alphaproteobacteria bacterium]